ncbi:MAG: hypothetical protein NC308_07430 [Clostridium sp.]|nr:hypothetical protein [Bacteroides sp.]MCM1198704.1 hypothetical protein [Clostridium sp.]
MWRNRIKYYANYDERITDEATGLPVVRRDWKEYRKEKWMLKLKDTATICSCWMCRNYLYDRREYRRYTFRILREQTED